MDELKDDADARLAALGLHLIAEPYNDNHHTDMPFTPEDEQLGAAIAYYLGTLFGYDSSEYLYSRMTSIEEWSRVARALRLHGLQIVDKP